MIDIQENFQIEYPTSDGKPMAENTQQFEQLVKIKLNLEKTTAGQNIFVAGDLLWYPVQGSLSRVAPDVMVAIGRPKGHRGSYMQWKEANIAPQIVFEIWSPGNSSKEKEDKLAYYELYGVQEYYTYDTHKNIFEFYIRNKSGLSLVPNVKRWKSPLLGITLDWTEEGGLELYHPNGERFLSYMELVEHHSEAVQDLEKTIHLLRQTRKKLKETQTNLKTTQANLEATQTNLEATQTNLEATQTNLEKREAELKAEKKRADELIEKNRKLLEKLQALGLNPDDI